MNNDALVAALGLDAVAAVHGYRLGVLAEAERWGLHLVSEALSGVVSVSGGIRVVVDPVDIRLAFIYSRPRPDHAGTTLSWGPAHGWSLSHRAASAPLCFYAGPRAAPLDLVPTPPQVLDWATGDPLGTAAPPVGVELDDEPRAIHRLLAFIDPKRSFPILGAFAPMS
jgi:hypothetical protein